MEEICKKIMRAVGVAYFDGEDVFENGMGQVLLMVLDEQRRRSQEHQQDYAYNTIDEYEEITGVKVNEAFRVGFAMARVTNKQLRSLGCN